MALIRCPDCGRKVSDMATACPDCARPIAFAGPSVREAAAGPGRPRRQELTAEPRPKPLRAVPSVVPSVAAAPKEPSEVAPYGAMRERVACSLCGAGFLLTYETHGTFVCASCEAEDLVHRSHWRRRIQWVLIGLGIALLTGALASLAWTTAPAPTHDPIQAH
jgi:hypothetical protein